MAAMVTKSPDENRGLGDCQMFKMVKRIAGSAPIWAWIVMIVCTVVLVVGLIVSSNRTAPKSGSAAEMTRISSTSL